VPEDCAVVGFNNIPLATMVTPQLTSVDVDLYRFGQTRIRALFDLMQNPDAIINPTFPINGLVVRESSE
jgi:LacI family transcriptional regulator